MKTKSGASFVRQYLLITITSTLLFFLIGVFSVRWFLSDSKNTNRNELLLPLVLKLETGELSPIEQKKLYDLYGDSSKDFPFVFTIIAAGLIFSILTSTFSILFYLRKKAQIAESVMNDLKAGKLDSRFPTEKFDEFTHLMNHFNDMADQIKTLVLELKEKDQKRKELVQEISHDIKTPLSSLLMSADILEKNADSKPEKKKQIVDEIRNEGEYIAILLDDLLFLSIVEDPNFRIHKKEFDLVGLLADVVKVANQKFTNIQTIVELCPNLKILADEVLIKRALRNLIENSYSFARKRLTVKLSEDKLEICDDGPGFNPEILSNFGKKRLNTVRINSESDLRKSTGLGAVIANRILSHHEFALYAENLNPSEETTKGAKIVVSFIKN